MSLDGAILPVVDAGACPHMAILLDTWQDSVPVLARFYALGARRGAYLFHRALPACGDVDRGTLGAAGFDAPTLEQARRMLITDGPLEDEPSGWVQSALDVFDDAVERGFGTVWWSRFPVPPQAEHYARSLAYDRVFHEAMRDRDAVSLCLYVVGGLDAETRAEREAELAAVHDGLLLPGDGDGWRLTGRTGSP